MNEKYQCPECNKPLSDASAHGLCPACLMGEALASRTLDKNTITEEPIISIEEMSDKFPEFKVVEYLGRGGMGVVYKAQQKSLKRWVAIKVLAPERVGEAKFAARFSKEAQTLAKMSHPNIVTVFDHGETDGLYYIVMEYVEGVNLRELLREGRMTSEQALSIVPPICEALEYAHNKDVVHRDIKPENLLLDRDGRIKIADFGIASLVGTASEKSGTPPYMAPEQENGNTDRRSDIYALGIILYEMLTGERPQKDVIAPSRKVEIDVRIDEMVLRAMEKEPERRYQTANEFRTMVQTISEDSSSEKVTPSNSGFKKRLLENFLGLSSRVGEVSLWALGVGLLTCLGAIANFNFSFGVKKSSMLLVGVILMVSGLMSAAITSKNGNSYRNYQSSNIVANIAIYLAFLSGLIPTLFYWFRPLHGEWLSDQTVNIMLRITLVVAILALALGCIARKTKRGRVAAVYGGVALTIWILFFIAGKITQQGNKKDYSADVTGFADTPVSTGKSDFEAEKWVGTYLAVSGGQQVKWRIVEQDGNFHWLESPTSTIREHNRLNQRDGALHAEDDAERFRFTPIKGGIRFEMWSKRNGNKVADITLNRLSGAETSKEVKVSNKLPVSGVYGEIQEIKFTEEQLKKGVAIDLESGNVRVFPGILRPKSNSDIQTLLPFDIYYIPEDNEWHSMDMNVISSPAITQQILLPNGERNRFSMVQNEFAEFMTSPFRGLKLIEKPNIVFRTREGSVGALEVVYLPDMRLRYRLIDANHVWFKTDQRALGEETEVGIQGASYLLCLVDGSGVATRLTLTGERKRGVSLYIGKNRVSHFPFLKKKLDQTSINLLDSNAIKLENGRKGPGIIFSRGSSKMNLAMSKNGIVPMGKILFRHKQGIRPNAESKFGLVVADLLKPDGTKIPISLKLENLDNLDKVFPSGNSHDHK